MLLLLLGRERLDVDVQMLFSVVCILEWVLESSLSLYSRYSGTPSPILLYGGKPLCHRTR